MDKSKDSWYDDLLVMLNEKTVLKEEKVARVYESWYYDPTHGRLYYLQNLIAITNPTFPVPAKNAVDKRVMLATDLLSHEIDSVDPKTGKVGSRHWVVVAGGAMPVQGKYSLKEIVEAYPKHPNLKTLEEFVDKYSVPGTQTVNLLDKNSLVKQHTSNGKSIFVLLSAGHTYMRWEENMVSFYLPGGNGGNVEWVIKLYKAFAGEHCQFELKDDIWGFTPPLGEWTPLHNGVWFHVDAPNPLSKQIKQALLKDQWGKELVKKYIDNITVDTIIQAFDGMSEDSTIVFRCGGCMLYDSSHMTMHMERGDVTPYIILSAFKQFGNEFPDKTLWQSVYTIRKYKDTKVLDELKRILKTFLLDCILFKGFLVREQPRYSDFAQGWRPSKWRHSRLGNDSDAPVPDAPMSNKKGWTYGGPGGSVDPSPLTSSEEEAWDNPPTYGKKFYKSNLEKQTWSNQLKHQPTHLNAVSELLSDVVGVVDEKKTLKKLTFEWVPPPLKPMSIEEAEAQEEIFHWSSTDVSDIPNYDNEEEI